MATLLVRTHRPSRLSSRLGAIASLAVLASAAAVSNACSSSSGSPAGGDDGGSSGASSSGSGSTSSGSSSGTSSSGTGSSSGGSSSGGGSSSSSGGSSSGSIGGAAMLTAGLSDVKSLTVVGGKLNWINGTMIQSMPTTGGTPTAIVTDTGLQSDLTTDGTSLYFVVQTTSDAGNPGWEIDSTDLTGASRKTVVSGVEVASHSSSASQIFVVAGNVYFNNFSMGIASAPVGGGAATALTTPGIPPLELVWADSSGLYMLSSSGALTYTPLAGGTPTTLGTPAAYTADFGGQLWAGGGAAYYATAHATGSLTLDLYKSTPPAAATLLTSYTMEGEGSLFGDSAGMYLIVGSGGPGGIYKVDPTSGAETRVFSDTAYYGASQGVQALDATNLYFGSVSASMYTLFSLPR